MMRLLFLFLFFLSSCDNGSDLNIEEVGLPETAEIYLLKNLDPGFVYPENLQYISSREVKSSVCIDINAHIDASITRPAVPPIVDPSNPAAATPNTCLLYTSPSPRDGLRSRMPSSA